MSRANAIWPASMNGTANAKAACKMAQILVATDIMKYTGKSAGIDYLKASDPEAAHSIQAQENSAKMRAPMQ
jgi:hypothetical protein